MARKSFDEALRERRKAKENGTYQSTVSEEEKGNDISFEEAIEKRRAAIKKKTYTGTVEEKGAQITSTSNPMYRIDNSRKNRQQVAENISKDRDETLFGNRGVSYHDYKKQYEQSMNKMSGQTVTYEQAKKMAEQETENPYSGLTNRTYGEYLTGILDKAEGETEKYWVKEQVKNLEELRDETVRKYVGQATKWYKDGIKPKLKEATEAVSELKGMGYSNEQINSMMDTYVREENASATGRMLQQADEETGSFWGDVGASVKSLGTMLASGVGILETGGAWLKEKLTGEYTPVDTNSAGHMLGKYTSRVRQNVTKDIEGDKNYTEEDEKNIELLQNPDIRNYIEQIDKFYRQGNKIAVQDAKNAFQAMRDMGYSAKEINSMLHTYLYDGVPVARKALGGIYNAGMSVGDNATAMGAGSILKLANPQNFALAALSTEAAAGTSADVFERTGSTGQAFATGLASGAVEALTEKISLDNLWDMLQGQGKAATRSMLVNWIVQSGIEGSEEGVSEIANNIIDRAINQHESEYEINVQNYINNGLNEEQAREQANKDFQKQVEEAVKMGVLAGGISGGFGTAALGLRRTAAGNSIRKSGQSDAMIERAGTYEDAKVQEALRKYQEHPSDYAAGRLMNEMQIAEEIMKKRDEKEEKNQKKEENTDESADMQVSRELDAEESLSRMNHASNAEELVDARRYVEENGTPEQTETAQRRFDYQKARMISEGQENEDTFIKAEEKKTLSEAYELGTQNAEVPEEQLSLGGKIRYNEGKEEYLKEEALRRTITDRSMIEQAEAVGSDGKNITVSKLKEVEAEPMLETNTGTIALRDVSFVNTNVQKLYNAASTKGTTAAANMFLKHFPAGMTVNNYETLFDRFENAGELGISFENTLKWNKFAETQIGRKGLREIYDVGKEKNNTKENQEHTVERKGTGKVIDKRKSKTKEPLMDLYVKLAEKTGIDITLKDSDMDDINGSFEMTVSEIVLNTESNTYAAAMHELGEFTDLWNEEGMRDFQTAFLEWYFDEYQDTDEMVRKYKRVYEQVEGSKSLREAADEMMRDGLSGLFGTEEGARDFTNWLSENRTQKEAKNIIQTITDFLKNLCDKIMAYIDRNGLSGTAEAAMRMEADKAEQLRKQFLDAADKAIENYQKADVKKESKNTKRHSQNVFGLDNYSKHELENWNNSNILIANSKTDIIEYVNTFVRTGENKKIYAGKIGEELASRIKQDIGLDLLGYNIAITNSFENSHSDEKKENLRGQIGITPEIVALMPEIISSYDEVKLAGTTRQGKPVIKFIKNINGEKTVVEYVSDKKKMLYLQTMYGKVKKMTSHPATNAIANATTSETTWDMKSSDSSVPQNQKNATENSEKTSEGKNKEYADIYKDQQERGGDNKEGGGTKGIRHQLNGTSDLDFLWESYDGFDDVVKNSASILEQGAKEMQGKEVNRKLVHKIAWHIKQDYRSGIDLETLTDNLVKVFSYMQTQEKANYEDLVRVMNEVAQPVLEESNSYDPDEQKQYSEFKKNLKSIRIKLSERQKAEVAEYYDSYENFRRKMFGTITLAEDGQYLDSVWSEIVDFSNGYLDLNANYAEQAIILADAIQMMKPQLHNNFGVDNNGVAMDLSLGIYEEYFKAQADSRVQAIQRKMVHERAVWHDKVRKEYYQKLSQERERMKEKTGTIEKRVAEVRAAYTASELDKKKKQKSAQYRQNIKRTGAQLIKWIESPTDKQHVPEKLKKTTLEFLSAIDFISHRALDNSNSTISWREKMRSVYGILSEAEKSDNVDEYGSFLMDIDPDFLPTLNQFVENNKGVEKISLMDYSQLKELNTMMNSLKRTITRANEFIANENFQYCADAANKDIRELQKKKDRNTGNELLQTLKELNFHMLDARSFFETIGEGAKSIYRSIRTGFDTRTWHILEAQKYMEEVLKDIDKKELKKWTGDHAEVREFRVKDGILKLNPSQVMSLYLHQRRTQSMRHILAGGVVASEIKAGKKKYAQTRPVHLTKAQLQEIIGTLTPEQKHVADRMQRFLAVNCAEWGNRASMKMYGYKKFMDDMYFPIKTYGGQIASSDKNNNTEASLYAIRNQGCTKNISKDAKNAIMLEDIMDVFTKHVVGMANYDAFAAPLSDSMKWFNYKNGGMVGEDFTSETMKEEMERVYGKEAENYFIRLIKDINGEVSKESSTRISDILTSNYKAAAVMANVRVVLQQPTAYMRASLLLSPVDMLKSLARNPEDGVKKAKKNSAIANWKSLGYYETSMGQSMKSIITGQQSLSDKIRDKGGMMAQMADEVTWGYLWNACESEVSRMNPDMRSDSEEFRQKVTERFDDVIDQTQVVDTILHRSQIMRSKSLAIKWEVAFMSEPHKSYNMLYRAGAEGKKQFGKAAIVYAMTGVFTSMAAALADAWRDDEFEKGFKERYTGQLLENMEDNLNPFGMIPYVKDIINLADGYDVERMDMAGFARLVEAIRELPKFIIGESKKTGYGMAKLFARPISQITGIPAYNIMRETEVILENMMQEPIAERKDSTGDLYKKLIKYGEENDTENYNKTYEKLLESGKDEKKIRAGVRTKVNSMFKKGELTEDEAAEILEAWDYDDVYEIIDKWKENMEK